MYGQIADYWIFFFFCEEGDSTQSGASKLSNYNALLKSLNF